MALFKSFSLITSKLSPVLTVATQIKTTITTAITSTVEKVTEKVGEALLDSPIGNILESVSSNETITNVIGTVKEVISGLSSGEALDGLTNVLSALINDIKGQLSDGIDLKNVLELMDSLKYLVNYVIQNNDTIKDSTLLSGLIGAVEQVKSVAQSVGDKLGLQLDVKDLIMKLEPAVEVLNKVIVGAFDAIDKISEVIGGLTGSLNTLAGKISSASSVDSLLSTTSSGDIDLNGLLAGTGTTVAKSSSVLDLIPAINLDNTFAELLQPTSYI